MEANRDEAIKCASIARRYFSSGDVEKARKWCLKALRLHSAVDIHGMEQLVNRKQTPPASRRTRTFESNRSTSPGRCENDTERCSEQTFSKAQTEAVRKVLACKDYYELLGVDKDSAEDEIKRAYKGLALKFHPDKNRAPGATEAFKKIGNAFNVLTNPEKRRRYDQFGTEEEIPRITRAHRHGDAFFQYDGDPFMMFFNNSFPFAQVYRNQQRRAASAETERENNHFVYLQLLPLIILFALSFLGNLFIKEPYYSLARSSKYPVERHTTQHSVPYYVKPNFKEDFTGPLRTLEAQIEEDFGNNLRYRCIRERDAKENLIFRARYYGDEDYERATKIPLPHCDRYMKMFGG